MSWWNATILLNYKGGVTGWGGVGIFFKADYPQQLFFTARPIKIISLILSQANHKLRRKQKIPEKNHLTTRKQNLACLTCDLS